MSYKSRGCWGYDWTKEHFKQVFGHNNKPKAEKIVKTRHTDEATRGDYRTFTRHLDTNLQDYKRFKSKGDKKKINNEYLGRQQEWRKANTFIK